MSLLKLSMVANSAKKGLEEKIELRIKSNDENLEEIHDSNKDKTLAGILPYEVYDLDYGLFHNKKSQGFILEVMQVSGASEKTIEIIYPILIKQLPKNINLQFILWSSVESSSSSTSMECSGSVKENICKRLVRKCANLLGNTLNIRVPIQNKQMMRDCRLFVSISLEKIDQPECSIELIALRSTIINLLRSIKILALNLSIDQFIKVTTSMFMSYENL